MTFSKGPQVGIQPQVAAAFVLSKGRAVFLCRPQEQEVKMDKAEMFGFSLEADDRTEEEKLRQKAAKKGGLGSALGLGQESPAAPMDTDYQEEMEDPKPKIRFNLNFDK